MKKILNQALISVFLFSMVLFGACENRENDLAPEPSVHDSMDEAQVELTLASLDADVQAIMLEKDQDLQKTGSLISSKSFQQDCREITIDTENKVITVDFGTEGCTGLDGKTRKGKILISYTARIHQLGAVITMIFDSYYVNNLKIEGTRVLKNKSIDAENGNIHQEVILKDGKIIFPDGTTYTRNANWVRTWVRGANPSLDEFYLEGSANGTNRRGVAYEVEITKPLVRKAGCMLEGIYIPVAGTKEFLKNDELKRVIDFGDGSCDRNITITIAEKVISVELEK
ncbi:hypothetical protein AAG747_24255 [Rapidithrix thailandica]|uniref:Lipoprotein n=1 Tax=Rapidithrix thailandica TaxID=413964 RepID=A0AAW9SDE6_9BACT